jgi:hypothetical protein
MRQYIKIGFIGNFLGHIRKAGEIRINYFITLDNDNGYQLMLLSLLSQEHF